MKMTHAIVFDLFGTLVPPTCMDKFLASIDDMAAALELDSEVFRTAWFEETADWRLTGKFGSLHTELEHISKMHGGSSSEESIANAVSIRYELSRDSLNPRSDTFKTLRHLKEQEFLVSLISDCSLEVPELWNELPYSAFFDVAIFSCMVGLRKPDPEVYYLACRDLGVEANRCLYIGDGGSNELSGARAVGMRAIKLKTVVGEGETDWERELWDGETVENLYDIVFCLS